MLVWVIAHCPVQQKRTPGPPPALPHGSCSSASGTVWERSLGARCVDVSAGSSLRMKSVDARHPYTHGLWFCLASARTAAACAHAMANTPSPPHAPPPERPFPLPWPPSPPPAPQALLHAPVPVHETRAPRGSVAMRCDLGCLGPRRRESQELRQQNPSPAKSSQLRDQARMTSGPSKRTARSPGNNFQGAAKP
eukprot:365428-Chlamydomonas_euryale.AAC.30